MLPFPQLFTYGNTIETAPVFLMTDFLTTADIKDKGPYSIPVTNNGNIPVGADAYGTYMNFTGLTTQWLEFASTNLNIGEAEIRVKLSNFQYRNTMYQNVILDGRPYQTNGPYLNFAYTSNVTAPFQVYANYNSSQTLYSGTINAASYPIEVILKIRTTGTSILINGVQVASSSNTINFVNQQFKVGRNAFIATAAVPYLYAKVYHLEIRKYL